MKNLVIALLFVMSCATALIAQTNIENKSKEPVSLAELSKQPICGDKHIDELTAEINAQPQNPEYYLRRAYCYKKRKNPDFIKEVLTIVNLNPPPGERVFESLNYLVLGREPAEMEANLNYLAAAIPDHWYFYSIRAIFKADRKDFQSALDDWLKATELMPRPLLRRIVGPYFPPPILSAAQKDLALFDRTFGILRKRQLEAIAGANDFSARSAEYREARRNIDNLGYLLQGICLNQAFSAARGGDPKAEIAFLDKMTTIEPRWRGYQTRGLYYARTGNKRKAFDDEFRAVELQIQFYLAELNQTETRDRQSTLKAYIGELYSRLGDFYVQKQQFVKAIDNYEKAKSYSRPPNFFDWKIKAALKRLNVSAQ